MKLRNAHSSAFALPDGRKLAVGDVWMNAPESMRHSPLVARGAFVIVEDNPPTAPKQAPRSGRGGK